MPLPEEDTDDSELLAIKAALIETKKVSGNVVHIGKIVEKTALEKAPSGPPMVLVQVGSKTEGGYTRNWMPWVTARAGCDGEWWHPEVSEQVLVVAPSGDLALGVVVGALYRSSVTFDGEDAGGGAVKRDAFPDSASEQIHQRIYKDGTSISYDREQHELALEIKGSPQAKKSLAFTATMDPEGASAGTGKLALKIGDASQPDIDLKIDTTTGGELQLTSKLKTTLIAGAANDPKIKILADASAAGSEKMMISAGATVVTINKDGKVEINAGSNEVAVTGNVKVTGTLDVS